MKINELLSVDEHTKNKETRWLKLTFKNTDKKQVFTIKSENSVTVNITASTLKKIIDIYGRRR